MFYLLWMPAYHPSANRYRNRLLKDGATAGQIIMIRCGLCKRSANYWASDLVKVLGPDHEMHVPPFPCSRCKTKEYIDVKFTVPQAAEWLNLTVRRPVKQVTRWVWRDEKA